MADMNFPGMVTSNVVGSTTQSRSPEQEATHRMQQQRQWDIQDRIEARKWKAQEEARMYALERQRKEQERGEAEGRMKQAYQKMYAPTLESVWDQQSGQILGVNPRTVEGSGVQGQKVYQKKDRWGMPTGRYQYRPDTNMPKDQYNRNMEDAWQMWKSAQMMGAKPVWGGG